MSWLHKVLGKDGATLLGLEPKHFAARVTQRPMELGVRGAYQLGVVSGVMAAGIAGNSEIFQARWIHATFLCLIRRISISAAPITAFTAGAIEFNLNMARSWSADGTGGTAQVMSTNNTNKKKTSHALSAFSDTGIRCASTAALGAGTKTLDTNRMASISSFVSSVATTADQKVFFLDTPLYERKASDEYPLLLATNEGPVVRVTIPGTGTWQFSLNFEWAEVDPTAVEGWT